MVKIPVPPRIPRWGGLLGVLMMTSVVAAEETRLVFPTLTTPPWYESEPPQTPIYFEPGSNTISVPGGEGRHVPDVSPDVETLLFEAEKLRAMGSYPQYEFCATPVGYPEKYPNDDLVNDACGGVSPTVSGKWAYVMPGPSGDTLWETFPVAQGGDYHVWVRYQDVYTRPEPFRIILRQNDEEVGTHVFGEADSAPENLGAAVIWAGFPVRLADGPTRLELHKPPDEKPDAGPRYIDQIMITRDLNYIPVGPEQLSWPLVQQRREQLGVEDQEFLVWSQSPWTHVSNKIWPQSKADLNPALQVRACLGEREQLLYLITHTGPHDLKLRVTAQLRRTGASRGLMDGALRVSLLSFIKSKRFGWVPDVLIPYPKLGRITLAPYHTAALWVEVQTDGLKAGSYRGTLQLAGRTRRNVTFDLTVLPAKMPAELDIFTFGWQAESNWMAADPSKIAFLYDHGINAVTLNEPQAGSVEAWRSRPMKLLITGTAPQSMKELGFRYDEWAYYLPDEPGDSSWPERAELARKLKTEDPHVRIMANPTWNKHASLPTIEGLAPYVDVWIPYVTHLRYPAALERMRQTGGKIGYYKCDGFLSKNPAMCYNYFRKFPWVAFYYDIDGCGFWTLSQVREHPWYDFDRPGFDGSGTDPLIVYPDETGYYATRNIEGFREGTEDYKYLMLLRGKVDEGDLKVIAERMLRSDTVAEVETIREELLDRIARTAR